MKKYIKVPMWDKIQFFCKNISDHQIRFVVHFDTFLDLELLKNAIQITIEDNPITFASYVENKNEVLWEFSECEIEKVFSFHECEEPTQLIHEKLISKLNTYLSPQLKLNLIRSKTDSLILNCDHTITDAAGVKDFMYQLAANYRILSQNETVQKQTYIPNRSLKLLSNKIGLKKKLLILKVTLSNKKDAPTFSRPDDLNNLENPGFRKLTIKSEDFDKLKRFGKKHSATVNDMLLAIYFFTLQKVFGNSNKTNRLTYTSDLRTYLDDYETLSNFSAIHNIDIKNTTNGFVPLLKEISSITKERKQTKYDLADFPMMAILFKTLPYKKIKELFQKEFTKIKEGKSLAAPSLTNMGIIDKKRISFGNVIPAQSYLLGTINHPSLLQLAVSTYEKEMTISTGSYYSEGNDTFISGFLEEFENTIKKEIL